MSKRGVLGKRPPARLSVKGPSAVEFQLKLKHAARQLRGKSAAAAARAPDRTNSLKGAARGGEGSSLERSKYRLY